MKFKIKFTKSDRSQISTYFNTLASAWFVAAIISPIFIFTKLNATDLLRSTFGVIMSVFFLFAAVRYNKTK